jgi:hypothetical protein
MKKVIILSGLFLMITSMLITNAYAANRKPPVSAAPLISNEETAIKYTGNDFDEEVQAEGQEILISGNNNRLMIKGKSPKLVITGKDNDIVIESVNSITITGSGNFVSWEKSEHFSGKPAVKDTGGYNNVGKKAGNALNKSDN